MCCVVLGVVLGHGVVCGLVVCAIVFYGGPVVCCVDVL